MPTRRQATRRTVARNAHPRLRLSAAPLRQHLRRAEVPRVYAGCARPAARSTACPLAGADGASATALQPPPHLLTTLPSPAGGGRCVCHSRHGRAGSCEPDRPRHPEGLLAAARPRRAPTPAVPRPARRPVVAAVRVPGAGPGSRGGGRRVATPRGRQGAGRSSRSQFERGRGGAGRRRRSAEAWSPARSPG